MALRSSVSTISTFIRRNIVTVLAVPPVVAAAFGIYAKMIRSPRPQKSAISTPVSVDVERSKDAELLDES